MRWALVTKNDVLNAYHFILGREPESPEAVAVHLAHPTIKSLRNHFINSEEFRGGGRLEIGRYIDRTRQEIQIDCSEAELDEMLEETSRTWSKFGEDAPHWSVLTNDLFTPENIEENISAFYRSGEYDVNIALNSLRRAGFKAGPFDKALDFGCGVGRLSMPLSKMSKSLTSVDVSPGHLKLAKERAVSAEAKNIDFIQLKDLRDIGKFSGYDFILSLIVLQHNPPPVMAYALKGLLGALRSGGVAVIQMPTYLAEYFSVQDYLANPTGQMEMHALPQRAIFEIIEQAGCRPVEVTEDTSIGGIGLSHRFTILKL